MPRRATQRSPVLPVAAEDRAVVAKFLRALADPTRLALLEFLLDEEHTVSECVERVGLSQGRVSVHLGCLADCGYVAARREGRCAYYRVIDPRVADLVVLARALAAENSAALALCERIPALEAVLTQESRYEGRLTPSRRDRRGRTGGG